MPIASSLSVELAKQFEAALTSLGRPDISLIVQSEGTVESHLSPRVSTLSFCARESARVVAAALLATLEDGRQRTEVLPFNLDIRASSGKVRSDPQRHDTFTTPSEGSTFRLDRSTPATIAPSILTITTSPVVSPRPLIR